MNRRTVLAIGGAALLAGCTKDRQENNWEEQTEETKDRLADYRFDTSVSNNRANVYHSGKRVAILTEGARTVVFDGKKRTFSEPDNTKAVVHSHSYVRVAPKAWYAGAQDEDWFSAWFLRSLREDADDILGAAMQYLDGSPTRHDSNGVPFRGDAGFGLVRTSDTVDGADFYDYLGIPWKWPDGSTSQPSKRWFRKVDCSGYIRLVYGYRGGITLHRTSDRVEGLPRNARGLAKLAPSVLIAEGKTDSSNPTLNDLGSILPGDLVFFALHDNLKFISHSGIYIGDDNGGHMRFLSSRTSVNGPTFGDFQTKSIFDDGFFYNRLRRVIRL